MLNHLSFQARLFLGKIFAFTIYLILVADFGHAHQFSTRELEIVTFPDAQNTFTRTMVSLRQSTHNLSQRSKIETSNSARIQCLIDSREAVLTENLKIDWSEIRELDDLDRCVMLVAKSIQDNTVMNKWLSKNGFKVLPPRKVHKNVMKTSFGITGSGWHLTGSMKKDDIKMRLGLIDRFFIHGMSIGLYLDKDHFPVGIQSAFTRK